MSASLLQPVIALVIWSFIVWAWMYATRIPAIMSMKMKMDPQLPAGQQMSQLPATVRWKAENYNNLMEQPTIFYAIVLSLALLGADTKINIITAWCYVGLRVLHSLVQVTMNKIELRFILFILSNVPLAILTYNAAMKVI